MVYAGQACQLSILQNDKAIGTVQIPIANTNIWSRKKVTFELQAPEQAEEALVLSIVPTFDTSDNAGESIFLFFFTTIRGRRTSHTTQSY